MYGCQELCRFNILLLACLLVPGAVYADGLLEAPELRGIDEIVFAVRNVGTDGHWYANLGYYSDGQLEQPISPPVYDKGKRIAYALGGGRLCRLNIRTGEVATLLEDAEGAVRDPVLDYDAERIVFSYRRGDSANYHLYEINVDGTGLEQLTDGIYDDIEPCFLPNGQIMFASTRCKRWVQCWVTQVAVLYVCEADGSNIQPVSANLEHDNTPWPLPDGRILYQRWEYVDRSQVDYHHLWTMNPDGTNQTVYYGNMHPSIVMIDAKPIPNTNKVVALFSPGHGQKEHAGVLTIVDPGKGPDDRGSIRRIRAKEHYRDPWAFSETTFMAVRGVHIVLLDRDGTEDVIYTLPSDDLKAGAQVHEPRPIIRRARERVIPPRVRPTEANGQLVLANVYEGRNMEGVGPGDIKKLLVIEALPKPINFTGGMDPLTYGGSFTLERVLGTVPVESDGSAYMELPAKRALFFVALDENDLSVKRMQSFLTVQPGEVTSCVGCHEQRTRTVLSSKGLLATQREPSRIEPIADCPQVFDFPRDIQPILDALCTDCHGYEKTKRGGPYAANLLLTGDHGPMFSHAYFTMTVRHLFSDGRNLAKSNYPPRALGSSASRIFKKIDGSHHDVKATEHQKTMLRLWIEAGAPYPGTYAALGCGSIGGYAENIPVNVDFEWPTTVQAKAVIEQRCDACHKDNMILPKAFADELKLSFWRFPMDDPRLRLSRHIVYNLSRPEKSLLLLAPLAKTAGGFELCKDAEGQPTVVFADTSDADYQTMLAMIEAGKQNLEEIKRFDMPGFQPREPYLAEMKRYGVLPENFDFNTPADPYELDRAYWDQFVYRPEGTEKMLSQAGADDLGFFSVQGG